MGKLVLRFRKDVPSKEQTSQEKEDINICTIKQGLSNRFYMDSMYEYRFGANEAEFTLLRTKLVTELGD